VADDRLKRLEDLRDLLKKRITGDDVGSRTAALAKQYRDTLKEIDELQRGTKKGSLVDELAKRRQTRSATPKGRATPARRSRKSGS
jgi:hypothetical protein